MGDSGKNKPGGKVRGGGRISVTAASATAAATTSVLTDEAVVASSSTSKCRARSLFVHGWNSSGDKLKINSKDLLKALTDDGYFITSPFNVTESQAADFGAKECKNQWWNIEKVVEHPSTISGFRQTFDTKMTLY